MKWTTPQSVQRQVQRWWETGDILRSTLDGHSMFPKPLRFRGPTSREFAEHFDRVQDWLRALDSASKQHRGHGYEIHWGTLQHRVHGTNKWPLGIFIPTHNDALKLLKQTRPAQMFSDLMVQTQRRCAELLPWLARRPLQALAHAEHWGQFLDVLDWLKAHPRSGLYLRQVDLPGIDSKFIEQHRGVLSELLDNALDADAIDSTCKGSNKFAERYGFRGKSPLVRFRLLDSRLFVCGLSDISTPIEQFAALDGRVGRVFVTENDINGLAFPEVTDALVIFGLGYGVERLAEAAWLKACAIYYWGDIDTHGFAILNRLRSHFPHVRSLMMNRPTLEAHRLQWGEEPEDRRFLGTLNHLSVAEQQLYQALCTNEFGERLRLEQERIGFTWACRAIRDSW